MTGGSGGKGFGSVGGTGVGGVGKGSPGGPGCGSPGTGGIGGGAGSGFGTEARGRSIVRMVMRTHSPRRAPVNPMGSAGVAAPKQDGARTEHHAFPFKPVRVAMVAVAHGFAVLMLDHPRTGGSASVSGSEGSAIAWRAEQRRARGARGAGAR